MGNKLKRVSFGAVSRILHNPGIEFYGLLFQYSTSFDIGVTCPANGYI